MIKSKGLVGTLGIYTNLASSGCVRNASSICVVLLTIKMPLSVKCKCPHKVIVRPSKKSYETSVTRGGTLGSETGQMLCQRTPCPLEWTPYLS
jgi:hypothetical protein